MAGSWPHLIMAAMFTALLGTLLLGCGGGEAPTARPDAADSPQKEPTKTKSGVEFYFGCGCFWHMQHEFVDLEEMLYRREFEEITSRAAYAGGTKEGAGGLVCYEGDNNYVPLGHTEVVRLEAQEGSFRELADTFWEVCPGGVRKDIQDAGSQYRSVVGVPGGFTSKYKDILMAALAQAAVKTGKLVDGKGDEGDTGSSGDVYVYDTLTFPAFKAEKYHQFHDDMTTAYGKDYNDLRVNVKATTCPGDEQPTKAPTAAPTAAPTLAPVAVV